MIRRFLEIKYWYWRSDVKFEIVKQLKNKEFATFPAKCDTISRPVRTWRCHSVQHFDAILGNALHMYRDEKFYQMYKSISTFKNGTPFQTFNMQKRKKIVEKWNLMAISEIVEYPFFLDLDAKYHKDMEILHKQAVVIFKLLDREKYQFSVIFSGKGFHFVVYDMLKEDYFDKNGNFLRDKEAEQVALAYKQYAPNIDISIYDPRRLQKIPYSLAIYKIETFVCFPFSSIEEFLNFRLLDYTLSKIKKRLNDGTLTIRNRGVHIFNNGGTTDTTTKPIT